MSLADLPKNKEFEFKVPYRLADLLESKEFEFNATYRIVNYTPTEEDPDHVTVLYESDSEDPWPTHLMGKWISAINQDKKTGVIDIECY